MEEMSYKRLLFEYVTAKERADEAYVYVKKLEQDIKARATAIRDEGARKGVVDWEEE
jgi:hypothetical protein